MRPAFGRAGSRRTPPGGAAPIPSPPGARDLRRAAAHGRQNGLPFKKWGFGGAAFV
jgi:hypothetical protein